MQKASIHEHKGKEHHREVSDFLYYADQIRFSYSYQSFKQICEYLQYSQ